MESQTPVLSDVWQAQKRIDAVIRRTPLVYSEALSDLTAGNVYLKLENLNVTDSFKIRGAANKLLHLSSDEKKRGIVTFSTGNFGMSVAYLAKHLDIKATICIADDVPHAKIASLKQSGARIVTTGKTQDDAKERSYELARRDHLTVIHPFDDLAVITGHGTMALEIMEQMPAVDTVIGGLSGGGLHSGLGFVFKTINPAIHIYGVSPENGATMYASLNQGRPVTTDEQATWADSLLGGIGLDNRYTFSLIKQYVDRIVLMEERAIARGMTFMLEKHRMVVEGAAAIGVAALLENRLTLGREIVVVVSGGRVDLDDVLMARKACKS